MRMYAIIVFMHIIGAIALLIGLILINISIWRMPDAASVIQLRTWIGLARTADKLLPVGAALILLSGGYMVVAVWGWGHGWVNVSLAALLLVSSLVPTVIAPKLAEIHRAVADLPDGPVPSSLQTATHVPTLWTSVAVMTAVSMGITVVMVFKPNVLWSITAIVIALMIRLTATVPARRGVERADSTTGRGRSSL